MSARLARFGRFRPGHGLSRTNAAPETLGAFRHPRRESLTAMSCDEYKRDLHAYFAGALDRAASAAIERHAASCGPCGDLMRVARELSCKDFVAFLDDYEEGRLAPERRAVFERHLGICSDCTAYLDSYRKTMRLSALAHGDAPVPPEVPEELVRAILAARKK
jgi:anti-sigma factor RsiW